MPQSKRDKAIQINRRKNASPKGTYIDPSKPNIQIEVTTASLGMIDRRNYGNKLGRFTFVTRKIQGGRSRVSNVEVLPRDQAFDKIKKLRKIDRHSYGSANLTRD